MNYFDRLKKAGGNNTPARKRFARLGAREVVRDIMPPSSGVPQERASRERLGRIRPTARQSDPETVERKLIQGKKAAIRPEPTPTPAPEPELPIRAWEPDATRRSRRRRKFILVSSSVFIVLLFVLPTFAFPTFSIIVYPKVTAVSVNNIEFTADTASTAPDAATRRIPALLVSVEKGVRGEYESSGTKFVTERARGEMNIFNAFSSSPQTLVANTRFQDPSGKIFRLAAGIVIPGAKVVEGKIEPTSIAATVVADAPGEAYNIGPSDFRIPGFRGTPKYNGFYAKSEASMSGGYEGQARVVVADDLTRASQEVTKRLFDELEVELRAKIPAGEDFIEPDGAREVLITDVDQPKAGDRFDRFAVSASGHGRLFVIRASHVAEILRATLVAGTTDVAVKLPAQQDRLSLGGVKLTSASSFHFVASGELRLYREAPPATLSVVLRASTPRKAEAYLRGRDEVESFRIKRFPPWLWFIPGREGGLEVRIEPPA